MSGEEEIELQDLVAQTLELNGCLPKIRAQLRANLFLALDEDTKLSKQQILLNKKVKAYLEQSEGQLMFCIVREFLEFFNLDFTISVYEPETYLGQCYKYEGRQKILDVLGLKSSEDHPVLLQLIKIAQSQSKTLKINLTNINGSSQVSEETNLESATPEEVTDKSNSLEIEESLNKCSINGHITEELKEELKTVSSNSSSAQSNVETQAVLDSTLNKEKDKSDTFTGSSSQEESINGTENSIDTDHFSDNSQKKSQKSDKLKSKLDLSPLHLNKSRGSDILPSLYNKDFKERNNKDLDSDFDIKDDYEEDFMSGSEVEFSLSKVDCPKPLLEELQQTNSERSNTSAANSLSKFMLINKSSSEGNQKDNTCIDTDNNSIHNSSIMENIEASFSDGTPNLNNKSN